jgi:anti-anti-sigma factor
MHDFEVRVSYSHGTRATLRLRGDFDLAAADLFAAVLAHHLHAGHRFIRLDLGELTFLDCAGLRVIVEVHNQLLARGGRLTLIRVGPRMARLLRIALLDTVLYIASPVSAPQCRAVPHLPPQPA